jgi:macrolide-specific efflux system membrane fusion protein
VSQGRSQSKKYLGLGLVAVLALGAGAYFYWKKNRVEPVSYREVTVTRQDMDITILSTGVVQPQNRLEIKPPIAGRVEQVLVQEGDLVRKGQILAWMSSTERAALLDSARAQGPAELKRWEAMYRPTPIISPISGMIILKNVEPGQTFSNVDSVLVLSDRLTVKAQVDETDIAQVKANQAAEIILDAYAKQPVKAIVDKIAYDAKTVNNVTTYIVDVVPTETPEFMRSGMTANVTFFIESKKAILTIPSEALKVSDGRFTILVKGSDPKNPAVEKEIKVGLTDGRLSEVLEGVEEGAIVLIQEAVMPKGEKNNGSPFSPFGGGSRRRS